MSASGGGEAVVNADAGSQESPDWRPIPRAASRTLAPGTPGSTPPGSTTTAPSTSFPGTPVDRDRDGLTLQRERSLRTSDLDRDTDDDGLSDGRELLRLRASPRRFDTDRDRISDGVERGVTRRIADPSGPVRGTARLRFRRDRDPRTRTNPRRRDSDRDGRSDGREDRNRNGHRDRGERNPLRRRG